MKTIIGTALITGMSVAGYTQEKENFTHPYQEVIELVKNKGEKEFNLYSLKFKKDNKEY